ncbi:MAG: phospho-N-acetylmuramoyl-pentapeptide-transferase [Planctomycetes bacterium]|nr:phospho-N-acetylmuramoyl-pentapeptide-transferase [Planctomycetota bacterium]
MLLRLFSADYLKLITPRAAMAGVGALLLCLLVGPRVIAWLRRRKLGERTEKGDSRRLDDIMRAKKDTPTMGGLFLSAAVLLAMGLFANTSNRVVPILVSAVVALCALGAVDDWMKLSGRRRTGMPAYLKLLGQCVIGYSAGCWLFVALLRTDPGQASRLHVPLMGTMDLGIAYPLFVMLVTVASSNAVNITDGLDGLAGGCLAISFFAFAMIAYAVGRVDFSGYLGVPYVRASAEVSVFCAAALGATLGFLWFNSHPAQVFMGDSGSLPMGGALGLAACATKQEFLLALVGGVFVVEAGSSLAQILWFKATGRRLFRIAPLHHHYQFGGVPETKIVTRFWIGAAVLAVASLATLKLR